MSRHDLAAQNLGGYLSLRWRIEVIFKTWKSHWDCAASTVAPPVLLQLSVLTKLVFCAVVCQLCDVLELRCPTEEHVSLCGWAISWASARAGSPPPC